MSAQLGDLIGRLSSSFKKEEKENTKEENANKEKAKPPKAKRRRIQETENWSAKIPFQGVPRRATLSVALPASIIENIQTPELQAYVVGEIARTLTVYGVDEVIVYEDSMRLLKLTGASRDSGKGFSTVAAQTSQARAADSDEEVVRDYDTDEELPAADASNMDLGTGSKRMTLAEMRAAWEAAHVETFGLKRKLLCEPPPCASRALRLFVACLQYAEVPPYLKKSVVKMSKLLKSVGVVNPADSPHHMKRDEVLPYREGVVTGPGKAVVETKAGIVPLPGHGGSVVDIGLKEKVWIEEAVPAWSRVTLSTSPTSEMRLVSPREPAETLGVHWGYHVRAAPGLREAMMYCPFNSVGSYDLFVGTSERGDDLKSIEKAVEVALIGAQDAIPSQDPCQFCKIQRGSMSLPLNKTTIFEGSRHALLVFGNQHGIEPILKDSRLSRVSDVNSQQPRKLFDYFLNVVPLQASRTVRTEEALAACLNLLHEPWLTHNHRLCHGVALETPALTTLKTQAAAHKFNTRRLRKQAAKDKYES
ncbi:MAG: uncharacterized protein KVP18_003151 [Porospora cf. gigantea A]|uniref:uncharacterized protein n=1 Tax=Porospora cf. gigantea A TaxID=2853593 RepID=UPI00355A0C9A|nr:MAG: hypothetical protein KVP18_003151 [Porospora cf. gigantea A]